LWFNSLKRTIAWKRGVATMDLLYLGLTLLFFGLSFGLIGLCERL
jgi:hypothetical protein